MSSSTLVFSFDTTFELLVAISGSLIVLSAFAILGVLLQIERTKVSSFSSIIGCGKSSESSDTEEDDLEFEESTSSTVYKQQSEDGVGNPSSPSRGGGVGRSPTRVSKQRTEIEMSDLSLSPSKSDSPEPPINDGSTTTDCDGILKSTSAELQRKFKRLTWSFIGIQIASVLSLILLTYLILVVSDASIPFRLLGALCVFFIYLRFQIGDELRQQRIDRILLLVSLFFMIAGMLSLCIYSFKTLQQGEVYEGPARIVGYDASQYNNSQHDPTTRTDIAVSWGKDWGCPMSGGKVCQARITGAMCQVHPEQNKIKHKSEGDARQRRRVQSGGSSNSGSSNGGSSNGGSIQSSGGGSTASNSPPSSSSSSAPTTSSSSGASSSASHWSSSSSSSSSSSMSAAASAIESKTESSSSTLEETEVEELEEDLEDEENAAQSLEEENNSLKEQNAELEKEVEELKEETKVQEEAEEDLIDEADSEIYEVEEEYASEVLDLEGEIYEDAENYEDELHDEKDKELKQKLNSTNDPTQHAEIEQEIDENDAEKADLDEEYSEVAKEYEEYADEYMDAADNEYSNALDEEDKYEAAKDKEDEIADEVDETEETINHEKINNNYGGGSGSSSSTSESAEVVEGEAIWDDWYWDEYPGSYDDDLFEDEYWDYDWDSVWGEYACEDLFDNEFTSHTYDPDTPAGGDDDWPFVMIYGSCKTCEAFILDYFAEEAFEEVEDLKWQAVFYSSVAVTGLLGSFMAYITYRVNPKPANQQHLMGYDGGVLA